jgi:hypothetical protein
MKKLIMFVVSIAMTSIASAVTVTADAAYKTKVLDSGTVIFKNAVVAGAEVEALGFVLGVNTFNPVETRNVAANKTASPGLFKRIDTTLGYRFTAPLANLTLGAVHKSFSKSVQTDGHSSNTALVARLNGGVKGTLLAWDAITTIDSKNRTNNVEANVRVPFGSEWVKIAPAVGLGFNDPGAATITALKDSKRYVLVGIGAGYYSKIADVYAEYTQRRDSLTSSGGEIDAVAIGARFRF